MPALHLPLFAWPFGLWIGSRWFMKEWVLRGKRENKWRFIWSSGLNSRCEREKNPPRRHFCSMFTKCLCLPAPEGCWLTYLSPRSLCVILRVCLRVKVNGKCVCFKSLCARLSRSLSLSLSLSQYSCRSDTQWRAAVPPHFNMAERAPHIYPLQQRRCTAWRRRLWWGNLHWTYIHLNTLKPKIKCYLT